MSIILGSARHDEHGKLVNGKAGDQTQKTSKGDMSGEVSMQNFYVHSKGWIILRPKSAAVAEEIARNMIDACNNANIGYDQNQRTDILSKGIHTTVKTETDCSTLIRVCVKEATGKDPGDFTTQNEAAALDRTGLFQAPLVFKSLMLTPLYVGDILVTRTKGHTVAVVEGAHRSVATTTAPPAGYYPKYTGTSASIIAVLKAIGETNTSVSHRTQIAKANGISGYSGTAGQNNKLVILAKSGKLKKPVSVPKPVPASTPAASYYKACKSNASSIVAGLASVGEKDTSMAHRKKIAAANGIANYKGEASQNVRLLLLLKSGKLKKA